MLGIVGIVVSLALLILLAYRGWNVIMIAPTRVASRNGCLGVLILCLALPIAMMAPVVYV